MSYVIHLNHLNTISSVSNEIMKYTFPNKKFLFYGDLGAGKTTLIKELSLQLGVKDIVSSPTFSIVNEYYSDTNGIIYHFDLFRINNLEEILDIGFNEYINSDSYCFIEWPNKVISLLEGKFVNIKITVKNEKRIIEVII